MKVCIIGTGYVGLSTGVCLAFLGHQVHCLDVNEQKIAGLRKGVLPIYEPGLAELFECSTKNLTFTTDAASAIHDAEVVFITVGTPSLPDGHADLQYIQAAAEMTGLHLGRQFAVVVNKSTVPVGTNRTVEGWVSEAFEKSHTSNVRKNFAVASNPEFLRQGSAIHDSLYADRIVIGSDNPAALQKLQDLYAPLIQQSFQSPEFLPRPAGCKSVPVVATDLTSAEIIKYAANAFLALKISFANEMAELAEVVNADITHVIQGMGMDRRIGSQFLQAGLGWGGSCFGKDTAALVSTAQDNGVEMKIVSAARHVNYSQRERLVARLVGELGSLRGKTIGLLGLAFKPNTDDLRDAPALDIARRLVNRGAIVRAHDPIAMDRARREAAGLGIQFCESVEEMADSADALLLVTEWPEYRNLAWENLLNRMSTPLVLDGRNFLNGKMLQSLGFQYCGIGKGQIADKRPDMARISAEEAILARQMTLHNRGHFAWASAGAIQLSVK